jgi:hypothetical protein
MIPLETQETVLHLLSKRLPVRRPDAVAFALKNRVLLAQTSEGFPVDISLGLPGYEDEVINRTVGYELDLGKVVHLCSAEDLILQKTVAARPQDLRDIEGIIIRQGKRLDLIYLRHWLSNFAAWLESDEVVQRFEQIWQKYEGAG